MEDVVIKLHDIARNTLDKQVSREIRLLADHISEKIKKEKQHGRYRYINQ